MSELMTVSSGSSWRMTPSTFVSIARSASGSPMSKLASALPVFSLTPFAMSSSASRASARMAISAVCGRPITAGSRSMRIRFFSIAMESFQWSVSESSEPTQRIASDSATSVQKPSRARLCPRHSG